MAAKAIVAERQSIALAKIKEHVKAITEAIGVDPIDLDEHIVGGDAPYKEMVRTEQMESLLGAVRAKVSPTAAPVQDKHPAPVVSAPRPQQPTAPFSDIDGSRKPARKPHK